MAKRAQLRYQRFGLCCRNRRQQTACRLRIMQQGGLGAVISKYRRGIRVALINCAAMTGRGQRLGPCVNRHRIQIDFRGHL